MESVNIFLSSTFEDLEFARNAIHYETLPQFQEYCILNDLVCNLIDLRWGISLSDEKERSVISRCLDDIEHCAASPLFFVGIIGERYGWIPGHSDFVSHKACHQSWLELSAKNKWSVTELECRYAESLKENTKTIYFIYDDPEVNDDYKLINLKKYLSLNGSLVIHYKEQSEIPYKLLNILKTWLFEYREIPIPQQKINHLIEKYYGNEASVSKIREDLLLGEEWDLYFDINGNEFKRDGVLAIDVFAYRLTNLKLDDALNSLAPGKYKKIKDYIFALLSISPLDGLGLSEIVIILSTMGFNEDDTKFVFHNIKPFLREYRGKVKAIHPRLESIEAFGLTENINPVLEKLLNYYKDNDLYIGDQHIVHAFIAKSKMNFFWRMGGATYGPNVLGQYWDEFSNIELLKEHYLRRKNLVYSVLLIACCIDFQLYRKFCRKLRIAAEKALDKTFFRDIVEDENIQRDFPLLTHLVAKGLHLSESELNWLSLRHQDYRRLCSYIIHDLSFNFHYKENYESLFGHEYWLEYKGQKPNGFFLHQLLQILKSANKTKKIPYSFSLFCSLEKRRGLEE